MSHNDKVLSHKIKPHLFVLTIFALSKKDEPSAALKSKWPSTHARVIALGAEQGKTTIMKRILMAGICLLALCGPTLAESFGAPSPPPPAPAPRLLMHNGSVMQINDVGP